MKRGVLSFLVSFCIVTSLSQVYYDTPEHFIRESRDAFVCLPETFLRVLYHLISFTIFMCRELYNTKGLSTSNIFSHLEGNYWYYMYDVPEIDFCNLSLVSVTTLAVVIVENILTMGSVEVVREKSK